MTDKEFFFKAVLAIIPPLADKQNEANACEKAIVVARQLTGNIAKLGLFDADAPITMTTAGPLPLGVAGQGVMQQQPFSPTGQHNGGLVSQQPIQQPIVVPTVIG